MPLILCHLSDDVFKRLAVFACVNDRQPSELASSWITDAARSAIPCDAGKPVDPHHLLLWQTHEQT